jgi:hypothetical protein
VQELQKESPTQVHNLSAMVENVKRIVPYVSATIADNNAFDVEKIKGTFHGDTKDWMAIHRGRARSSWYQLENLLKVAKELEEE